MEKITTLKYSNTNTYLIEGEKGTILFDTGWAGTFPMFCAELGRCGKQLKSIDHILISHFHPDHYGIAQEIADQGPVILACDVQKDYLHASDGIFEKDKRMRFFPIRDEKVKHVTLSESRNFLATLGINGEILHTPGHSDDSISLWLDQGALFVGDLNPLYELELHRGTEIERSWNRCLALKPGIVYYGHAKTAMLEQEVMPEGTEAGISDRQGSKAYDSKGQESKAHGSKDRGSKAHGSKDRGSKAYDSKDQDGMICVNKDPDGKDQVSMARNRKVQGADDGTKWYDLVESIMKYVDKGWALKKIAKKTGAAPEFIEDVTRMYLTHTNVTVQGILDRIEIKNR